VPRIFPGECQAIFEETFTSVVQWRRA